MGGYFVVVCFVYIGDEYPGLSDGWMDGPVSGIVHTSLYIFFWLVGWLVVKGLQLSRGVDVVGSVVLRPSTIPTEPCMLILLSKSPIPCHK